MKIAILTTPFYQDCKEVTRTINGEKLKEQTGLYSAELNVT